MSLLSRYLIIPVLFFCIANSSLADQKNLFTWFRGGESTAVHRGHTQSGNLPNPVAEFVFSKFGEGDPAVHLSREDIFKCYGELPPEQYWYTLELTYEGIRFLLPLTRNNSCGEEIRATFEELEPFMNKQGLRYVEQHKKHRKAKRYYP